MKALVYTGPERLVYGEAPDPRPGPEETLIRVEAVGVCGSDMHAYLGHDERRPAPLILGHEAAGTVLHGSRLGTRVTVNPLVTCGACAYCREGRDNLCPDRQIISMPPREGAFAELLGMPERNLVAIPGHVATLHAALTEPLACGWHAVRLAKDMLVRPLEEARCLVYGGGAIGLGAALSLAVHGAGAIRLVEPHAARRARIAEAVPFEVLEESEAPADLVIDGVGFEATRKAAFAAVAPGGVIAHIGLGSATGGLDARRATLQEITFFGTYAYTAEDFRQTAAAIFAGRMGDFGWVETRPLAEGPPAFADLKAGRVAASKIVLVP